MLYSLCLLSATPTLAEIIFWYLTSLGSCIEPRNKLANLGDSKNHGVVWGCIKEHAERPEDIFLISQGFIGTR